ncbi:putative tnp2 transposase [Senna tora]|uniref:Putative tnp2 transposase n=1 Tax=Senna tora TaxID=362788 RepID=A0A834XBN9_9FABA|nr:putative tnp2 transposase [Senna tora]
MYNRLNPGRRGYTDEILQGVDEFINFASRHEVCASQGKIRCPCSKHENHAYLTVEEVKVDLYKRGFLPGYWCWTCHGEIAPEVSVVMPNVDFGASSSSHVMGDENNRYESMIINAIRPHFDVGGGHDDVETKPRSLVDDQHALEVAYHSEEAYNVIPIDDSVLYVDLGEISQIAEEIEQAIKLLLLMRSILCYCDIWTEYIQIMVQNHGLVLLQNHGTMVWFCSRTMVQQNHDCRTMVSAF